MTKSEQGSIHVLSGALDQKLEETFESPEGTGRVLGFAASYLDDRVKHYKLFGAENIKLDLVMLQRIVRILQAGEKHLSPSAAKKKKA